MAKLILSLPDMEDKLIADAAMIGIVSATPAYHLCWLFSKYFDINFVREPGHDIQLKKKDNQFYFPVYQYLFPNSTYKYVLYKLKDGNEPLMPETKGFDYLWYIHSANPDDEADVVADGLRDIPEVQLIRIFIPSELDNLSHLLI